jgi:hypothetical protein
MALVRRCTGDLQLQRRLINKRCERTCPTLRTDPAVTGQAAFVADCMLCGRSRPVAVPFVRSLVRLNCLGHKLHGAGWEALA